MFEWYAHFLINSNVYIVLYMYWYSFSIFSNHLHNAFNSNFKLNSLYTVAHNLSISFHLHLFSNLLFHQTLSSFLSLSCFQRKTIFFYSFSCFHLLFNFYYTFLRFLFIHMHIHILTNMYRLYSSRADSCLACFTHFNIHILRLHFYWHLTFFKCL